MTARNRIIVDPDIVVGKPVVKGTWVGFLLDLLAQSCSQWEIVNNYPGVLREDLLARWAYAKGIFLRSL